MEDILRRRKEYRGKELLRQALLRFTKKKSPDKEVSVLDDQNSLLSMFKDLAKEKERRERSKLMMSSNIQSS